MIGVDIVIDDKEVQELLKRVPIQARIQLRGATEDILTEIELSQIHAYLSDSMPAQPPGTDYVRTFTLRASSQRRVIKVTSSEVEAEWFTNLDYAPFVIGSIHDQASIHQGRWLSLEEVAERVNRKAPAIVDEHLRKIKDIQ